VINKMDNRQCLGVDTLHQCLMAIFPSNAAGELKHGSSVESTNANCDPGRRENVMNKRGGDSCQRIPVKFTKNAIELLRETLTAFLRKVGRDLAEELEEKYPMSRPIIQPEQVDKVLAAFDDNDADNDADDDDEGDENTKKNDSGHSSKTTNRLPEMKEILRQAQGLLLERGLLERQQSGQSTNRKAKSDDPSVGRRKKTTKRGRAGPAGGEMKDSLATDEQQPPKKRGRTFKRPKIVITAELEAEQERLLNASKKALESSRQQQGGGGKEPSFRVELS